MVQRLALLRAIRQLEANHSPRPSRDRGLKETFKAALGRVEPGQLPLDMLPLRDAESDVSEARDRLAIRVSVEEQAESAQGWSGRVCRITLEVNGGRWPLELVGRGAAWQLKPESGAAVASFRARGRVDNTADRRRIMAALAELMGFDEAPPSLEGDEEEAGEFEVEHWGQMVVEGRQREVIRLKFSGLELYPLWLVFDRGAGLGEVLGNQDREERPQVLIGAELAMRGLAAYDKLYQTPSLLARPVWMSRMEQVGGGASLEASRLDGFCMGGPGQQELCAVYRDDDHARILRWRGLDREPEELWRGEVEGLESARWSAGAARVCLRYEEAGGPRFDLFDMTTRSHSKDVLRGSKEELDIWEIFVADQWPMIVYYDFLTSEDFDDDSACIVHVVNSAGEEVWRWVLAAKVRDVELLWTARGLRLELELEEGERDVWLWRPGDASAERLRDAAEAGAEEGHFTAARRVGYHVSFVDAAGQERSRWTPSCVDELDALYFWLPSDQIWAGDVVFLDDTMWSAVDTRSGQSRLLCGEDEASELGTVLAGGPGWVALQHDGLGLVWGKLDEVEGAVSGLWGGDAGGGSAW
jgi:hypothetical protein